MSRFFAALYITEIWHAYYRESGSLFGRAKAVVMFDRIITGQMHRIHLNGRPLDEYMGEAKP